MANCSTDDCPRPSRSRGLCGLHYDRWRRAVPPSERPTTTTVEERFAAKTQSASDGCLIWIGAVDPAGYGRVGVPHQRKTTFAHRVALERHLGRPLRHGMESCHTCDTPSCVEPSHLYEGTRQQNVDDCTTQLRHSWGARNGHHKLTSADVYAIRQLLASGLSQKAIADRYDVHQSAISRINSGRRWRHLAA